MRAVSSSGLQRQRHVAAAASGLVGREDDLQRLARLGAVDGGTTSGVDRVEQVSELLAVAPVRDVRRVRRCGVSWIRTRGRRLSAVRRGLSFFLLQLAELELPGLDDRRA